MKEVNIATLKAEIIVVPLKFRFGRFGAFKNS